MRRPDTANLMTSKIGRSIVGKIRPRLRFHLDNFIAQLGLHEGAAPEYLLTRFPAEVAAVMTMVVQIPPLGRVRDGRSHLAQFTLSFRQSFVIRHLLHQRGNWGTESLDQLID